MRPVPRSGGGLCLALALSLATLPGIFNGPAHAGGVRELPLNADYCSILFALTSRGDARCGVDQAAGRRFGPGQTRGFLTDPLIELPSIAAAPALGDTVTPAQPAAPPVRVAAAAPRPDRRAAIPASEAIGPRGYFIQFAFDSAIVEPDFHAHLMRLSAVMHSEALRGTCLRLVGHTDAVGPASYNMALGLRRARAVETVLTGEGGLDPKLIRSVSKGETELLDGIPPDHARNRRVEILSREAIGGACP